MLQVVFAISCKNNLSDVSVPPFNVTDCSSIIGGAHIHIFVFADHKKQSISKETNCAEHEYVNMCPPPPNYRAGYGPALLIFVPISLYEESHIQTHPASIYDLRHVFIYNIHSSDRLLKRIIWSY